MLYWLHRSVVACDEGGVGMVARSDNLYDGVSILVQKYFDRHGDAVDASFLRLLSSDV